MSGSELEVDVHAIALTHLDRVLYPEAGTRKYDVISYYLAIADAMLDSTPLVCITGQVPTGLIGTDAFQEVDTYGLSIPITKHNFLVRSADELLKVVPEAFRIAASGRPGPVWIDVPKDVQTESVVCDAWPDPGRPDSPPAIDAAAVERAAAMINAAQHPVLYLGGGVIQAEASALATALAESWERDTLDFSPSIVILLNTKSGLRCTDSATLLFFTISTPSRSLTIASLSIALSSTDPPGWVG